ncbi:MAG: DUF424 domain-containing protein [Nanoarchaeota archaeon]|nr:DUF424 domain-containing protein [Nanoarchaeota archaeon]
MLIKIIKTYRDVVAVCDKELIGKRFEEGKFQLEVKENFFNGDETDEEKAIEIMKQMSMKDSTFNIVGKKSVNTAIKAGIISGEEIRKIQNIPFALILM